MEKVEKDTLTTRGESDRGAAYLTCSGVLGRHVRQQYREHGQFKYYSTEYKPSTYIF